MKKLNIRLNFEPLDEGGFVGSSPDVPGLVVEGKTIEEVTELAYALGRDIAACYREHSDPVPVALEEF